MDKNKKVQWGFAITWCFIGCMIALRYANLITLSNIELIKISIIVFLVELIIVNVLLSLVMIFIGHISEELKNRRGKNE